MKRISIIVLILSLSSISAFGKDQSKAPSAGTCAGAIAACKKTCESPLFGYNHCQESMTQQECNDLCDSFCDDTTALSGFIEL